MTPSQLHELPSYRNSTYGELWPSRPSVLETARKHAVASLPRVPASSTDIVLLDTAATLSMEPEL